MKRLSPWVRQSLMAYLCALAGTLIGSVMFFIQTGESFGVFRLIDFGGAVVAIAAFALNPFLIAAIAPAVLAFGFVFAVLHMTAGAPLAVVLAFFLTALLYALPVCACRNAFAKRWPWLRWLWRVYLLAHVGVGAYALLFVAGLR